MNLHKLNLNCFQKQIIENDFRLKVDNKFMRHLTVLTVLYLCMKNVNFLF